MKSYRTVTSCIRTAVLSFILLAPTLATAATTIIGGSNGQGGGFFGISFGGGRGGFGGFGCNGTICGVASTILYLINNVLVPVLFAIAFIVFLYGVFERYILHSDKASSDGHTFVLWGVVGFAIMISLWGLVNIVANTFGLNGGYTPPLPTSPIYH